MGIEFEEITAQQDGNAVQQPRVDAVAVEDAVARHAARAQLSAQPGNGAPLLDEFLVYFLPYVDIVGHDGGLSALLILSFVWCELDGKDREKI